MFTNAEKIEPRGGRIGDGVIAAGRSDRPGFINRRLILHERVIKRLALALVFLTFLLFLTIRDANAQTVQTQGAQPMGVARSQGPRPRRIPIYSIGAERARQIVEAANRYGLDPLLVLEVMRRESAFDTTAGSHKGAQGLMQLMPATAARFGIRNPLDPVQAIEGGCRYLQYLVNRFQGRLELVLAGYNAGEGAVDKYGGRVPPYNETQEYVRVIVIAYREALLTRQRLSNGTSLRTTAMRSSGATAVRQVGRNQNRNLGQDREVIEKLNTLPAMGRQ